MMKITEAQAAALRKLPVGDDVAITFTSEARKIDV